MKGRVVRSDMRFFSWIEYLRHKFLGKLQVTMKQ